jgi:hypothetical protein
LEELRFEQAQQSRQKIIDKAVELLAAKVNAVAYVLFSPAEVFVHVD